jgi:Uma2 family endonuclease
LFKLIIMIEDEANQQEEEQPQNPKNYSNPDTDQHRISHIADIDFSRTYSYADYFRWGFEERLELIKGRIFRMSPAPSLTHQRLCGLIYVKLYAYLSVKTGEAFVSPFDVRLPAVSLEDEGIYTVVQPDICVVCDTSKLDERGCIGAPDLVVEILSPGNNKKELIDKYIIYEESGVREYWIINPEKKILIIYQLNGKGRFQELKDPVSAIFPDFNLNALDLFCR